VGCNLRDLADPLPIDLADFAGQRVGVDVFLNAYQFLTAMTGKDGTPLTNEDGVATSHLMGFLDRATKMVEAGIDPVFIFDGRPHDLKRATLDERRARKEDAKERWRAAVEAGDEKTAKKLGPQTAEYKPDMVAQTKRLFDALGVVYIDAPMEAEGAGAVRCARGEIGAMASQDWDTLLYGSPVMVRNLMAHGSRRFGRVLHAERINLEAMLSAHEIDRDRLVDLGIMVGTDFHPGIRGIGPKTGLKLIREHGSVEAVCEVKGKEIPERLDEIRALFHDHPAGEVGLPHHGMADEVALRDYLQGEMGFSDRRMQNPLDRMRGAGRLRQAGQSTLFDF